MLLGKDNRALDLLGLTGGPPAGVRLPHARGASSPKLEIRWGSFHQALLGNVRFLFGGPKAPIKFQGRPYFRDCWVERRMPGRALVAAFLWQIAFLLVPYPNLPARTRREPDAAQVELTWYGPVRELPPLALPGENPPPSPRGEPKESLPPKGADAFHPRQRIISDPVRPTHPRQTLINPAAPPEPPKILPAMPNIVQLVRTPQPAKPRLQISRETLAKLRPRRRAVATVKDVAVPEVPNMERSPGDLNFTASTSAPAKPKLELRATSAPRLDPRDQPGEAAAAPDIGADAPSVGSAPISLIALSATPAPPTETIPVPQGNLSARIFISPEGNQRGVPGGSPNGTPGATGGAGGGSGSSGGLISNGGGGLAGAHGISVSGGHPGGSASSISGLGGNVNGVHFPGAPPAARSATARPESRPAADAKPSSPAPDFAELKPGARPEEIFGPNRVYTLHVNMPNLSSATGSWVLSFVEMRTDEGTAVPLGAVTSLTGPVPLRKVDPKYPPAFIKDRVEGEVVLYAVIRKDGSVDSIQLVRGIDDQLDAIAMNALSRWKFRPAERRGTPVELEAIVHIPFRAVAPLY